jgi:hypothetical protein
LRGTFNSLRDLANDTEVEAIGRRSLGAILGGRLSGAMRDRGDRELRRAPGNFLATIPEKNFAMPGFAEPGKVEFWKGGEIGFSERGPRRGRTGPEVFWVEATGRRSLGAILEGRFFGPAIRFKVPEYRRWKRRPRNWAKPGEDR